MRQSPVSKLTLLLSAALLVGTALSAGCTPTCTQSCRKVLFRCTELDHDELTLEECQESCDRQESLYELEEDDELLAAFRDHRRCLGSSSCEEIASGVCYDGFEELFPFDPAAR